MSKILELYNAMLIDSFKSNKLVILAFFAITSLSYFSLPHLEQYHKSIQKENNTDETVDENKQK